jgi:hypothetical protein
MLISEAHAFGEAPAREVRICGKPEVQCRGAGRLATMNVSATTSLALGTARPGLAILWGGLICGTMDITAAITVYGQFGLKPVPLLQGIAAGLLGSRAMQGGAATALLGLICHYTVAFLAAATFVGVARFWSFPVEHFIIAGILYGPIVYFFMQLVVLPLSNAHRRPFSVKMMVIGLIIHVICVGLPITIAANRFLKE